MRTRTTLLSLITFLFTLFTLLLPIFLLSTTLTSVSAIGVDPATIAHEPYQYFHSDGVGGSNAVCWLSRIPFPNIQGVTCRFADTISQVKGRQIWQCEGNQGKFCQGCHELESKLTDPKEQVMWKVQGC